MVKKRMIKQSLLAFMVMSGFAYAAPAGVSNGLSMWVRADKGLDCMTEGCQPNTWVDQVSNTSFSPDYAIETP